MKFYMEGVVCTGAGEFDEMLEDPGGEWATRADAEQAAKDAVRVSRVALLLLQQVHKPKAEWVDELQAIIDKYEETT